MTAVFHSAQGLAELDDKINSDPRYAKIAKNGEGRHLFLY